MSVVEWSNLWTVVVAGILIETYRWGIERVSQSTQTRRGRKKQQPNHVTIVLQEFVRIVGISAIVLGALAWAQPSMQTKHLANHLTKRQTVMLAEAYLSHDTASPQLLDYINANATLLVDIDDANLRDSMLGTDHQVLVSLGLIEDGGFNKTIEKILIRGKPVRAPVVRYSSKITPLGVKVIRYKLKLPKPSKAP